MAAPNCFVKFLLLVWKNFSMLPGRKCYMISLFIFFVLLPILCMCLRLIPDLRTQPAIPGSVPTVALLNHFPENIYYSPKTQLLRTLVGELKINKATAFNSPEKLHEALVGFPYDNSSVIGIQFNGSWTEWPDKLSFALRAPARSVLDVNDMLSMEGSQLYLTAFLSVQQALSRVHIMYKCKELNKCQGNMTFPEFKDLPTPPIYGTDYTVALRGVAQILIQIIIFFVVISLTKSIVEEKELQLKETLNLLGVGSSLQWLAWYVQNFIVLLFGSAVITLCWKIVLPKADTSFVPNTHWSVLLFILLILSHCMICFSFLMSSLISTTRHISLITILALFATEIPHWVLYTNSSKEAVSAFSSLFILSGLRLLTISISSWEAYGLGLQWEYFFKHSWPGDTICAGYILLFMLLASLLSVLICLYVEKIRPGPYGVSRPWHFLCTCCCPAENLVPYKRLFYRIFGLYATSPDVERPDMQLIEADPQGKKAGIQIRGLSKTFGKREAVKPLSFDIFEDQITVLMGHNGAGKTTLISMLAGFISPTSGTAVVNGYDIRRERSKARRCIGLCPQHNSLFKHLSPTNHIWFFSRLRGVKGADVKAEVEKYLEKLNLQHRRKTAARNLSGGTQRRLSVACSLCGGVKVLICDEPSTGLDPGARRELWKLILEAKEGCTILLTTHHLDEGEVLGDRIVIISDGRLRCIGSLQFLKKMVDATCLLTCETRKRCEVNKLTALIARHVGEIRPFSMKGRDVCYKLPLSKSKSFSALFRDLENQMKELGVRGFGMSSVSLEEIFMSFGAEDFDSRQTAGAEKKDDDDDDDDIEDEDEDQEENERNCGRHWMAMMIKKGLFLYDNKVFFLLLWSLPIIYYLSTLLKDKNPEDLGRLYLNMGDYGGDEATILVSEHINKSFVGIRPSNHIASLIGKDIKLKVISEPIEEYMERASKTKEGLREITFMPMAVSIEPTIIGWVGPRHYIHAAPMTVNLIYNLMAFEHLGSKITIEVTNVPFKKRLKTDLISIDTASIPVYVLCYVIIAMILFSSAIIQERVSHMKMQQEVSGLGMITYWLSHLLFDMVVFLILALALLLPLYKYAPWDKVLLVLFFTGLAGLIFTYFVTLAISATFLAVSLILLAAYIAIFFVLIVGALALNFKILYVIIYIANLHPMLAGYACLGKCFQFEHLCESFNAASLTPEPKDPKAAATHNMNCVNPYSLYLPRCVCEHPIIWPEMIVMIVGAIIFWILIMFLEYGSCLWYRCKGCCTRKSNNPSEDPKVAREAEKIKTMDAEQIESRALVVNEVSKKYCCGPLAVRNISFAVKPYYCVGLLGPNGAGKTSTFKMIVGEHSIDRGNIYISGYSMKMKRMKAMKELGYCPQFDSSFDFLTGRQLLKFYLLLRGTEFKKLKERSEQLAYQFGFPKHLDKKIKYYSGGTKRKINAAVACRAKSLICLDEPSAGVDPASRRHVWTIINETANKGKAVLLTSHNMDEINALCTKSVILVDGSIYAMGSTQHVKNKIAKGMLLKLIVNEKTEAMAQALAKIEDDIRRAYPNARTKEKYEFSGRLLFLIPEEDSSWSQIFNFVENNRNAWQVADYSITQPTLEDVFVEIAEERKERKMGFR